MAINLARVLWVKLDKIKRAFDNFLDNVNIEIFQILCLLHFLKLMAKLWLKIMIKSELFPV